MRQPAVKPRSALQGIGHLLTQGTLGIVDLVEAMHARIERPPGVPTPQDERSGGLTGLVYSTVRGVTRLAGGSVESLLSHMPAALAAAPKHPKHDAVLAALNGVLGDHLVAHGNPLAINMALRSQGEPLTLSRPALRARFPAPSKGLLILVHGLCMNDRLWRRKGHDHGEALAAALNLSPIYLHYNTGLGVAENGAQFAGLMAQLLKAWPHRLPRVVLLAHSMGGLVTRSALAQAGAAPWTSRVSDFVCLGTPHHGAPLERAGYGVDLLLTAAPYAAPLARLGKVRSVGITNLRHGLGAEPPLPSTVRCWAIAGNLGAAHAANAARPHPLGDGLVPVASALGQHRTRGKRLAFDPSRQWVAQGVGHLDLLSSQAVARQLLHWLHHPL